MLRRVFAYLIVSILPFMACSSQRKLSRVETRELAAVPSSSAISALREYLMKPRKLSQTCPAEVRELLPIVAGEKVIFPPCPARVQLGFEAARHILQIDEKSTVEEVLNSQCRSLTREASENSLESLLESYQPPRGSRERISDRKVLTEEEAKIRKDLRDGLIEVRTVNEPLDLWIRINGEFVISEEQLEFLDQLVNKQDCKLSDHEVELSYRAMHSLEELARIQSEKEPQHGRVVRLLSGIHKVIDRKIREFFRP